MKWIRQWIFRRDFWDVNQTLIKKKKTTIKRFLVCDIVLERDSTLRQPHANYSMQVDWMRVHHAFTHLCLIAVTLDISIHVNFMLVDKSTNFFFFVYFKKALHIVFPCDLVKIRLIRGMLSKADMASYFFCSILVLWKFDTRFSYFWHWIWSTDFVFSHTLPQNDIDHFEYGFLLHLNIWQTYLSGIRMLWVQTKHATTKISLIFYAATAKTVRNMDFMWYSIHFVIPLTFWISSGKTKHKE